MPKYRKKPIVIDAVQYTDPSSVNEIMDMAGKTEGINNSPEGLYITTLEGVMKANKGDYIIKGIHNELYPCAEEIFLKSYELVE